MSTLFGAANAGSWRRLRDKSGAKLELDARILATLDAMGFDQMTPVQSASIPLLLSHCDVVGEAVTGSGKTLAFLIPAVQMLVQLPPGSLKSHPIRCIIVSPTRELGRQIYTVLSALLENIDELTCAFVTGGNGSRSEIVRDEERIKQGANLIVATPGRLLQLFEQYPYLKDWASKLELLVMDEADRLLSGGFRETLPRIIHYLPKQRRTALFSATQTDEATELMIAGLRNPVRVAVTVESKASSEQQATPLSLRNDYIVLEPEQKLNQLVAFIRKVQAEKPSKFCVFVCTCACVDYYATLLSQLRETKSLPIIGFHGKMKASKREREMQRFSEAASAILICTDVMARGIDVADIDWVLQYDAPQDPSMYVHRIGRTARNGREGSAIFYVMPSELSYINFLEIQKVPLQERDPLEDVKDVLPALRKLASKDRDLFQKGKLAFVSYIRSYKEHKCKYVLPFKDLDLGRIANGFALLHLPRMPELTEARTVAFVASDVDPDSIHFKDANKEKQFQANAKRRSEKKEGVMASKKAKQQRKDKNEAWSKQKAKRSRKREKKEKKEQQEQQGRMKLLQGIMEENEWDEDDLAKEVRLMKKLRKGKITKKEFEREVGETEEDMVLPQRGKAAPRPPQQRASVSASSPSARDDNAGHHQPSSDDDEFF